MSDTEKIETAGKVIDLMVALKESLRARQERDEDDAREARIAACTRCDGHGWLTSWEDRTRCECNRLPETKAE